MTYPPPLRPGDTVALIAPSGPCDSARLAAGVKVLEALGLRCRVAESCTTREGFLAGPEAVRLRDLHEAFATPEIRGVFAARGGYGAQRLLPHIDYNLIKNNPKIFAGYSDITALHIAFNKLCKLVTFHAPMAAADFGGGEADAVTSRSFKEMLFAPAPEAGDTLRLPCHDATFLVPGQATAPLTGGNLTLVAASLGTPYEIETRGRILFLEEVNEEPYKIDRLFTQLSLAGKLSTAAAIILGDFSPQTPQALTQTLNDILLPLQIPTIINYPSGHGSPNLTLPLGARVTVSSHPPKTHAPRRI
ncbi:MAG: LD-carboxypeptidase [Defluviitaleaceae bacterium]|nr:LD-carboxypeptidase [Defluviitaleaceae bacterium]MCL2239380.1 LD-carboxypeptidase [Defluviitaleaceae bacterium]